ncbi:sugar phosphate isomerase/epimerase family protein [Gracilibacillus alcaliphilus]|uniref:sugar phosphate isomerase/epimerase family protein n=1 Tax=Gracilibacillus alcaliphilus TaxID=1401441 RepID=UPI001958A7E7|nr:sugar phosphate isomerase/epimerase family protein [Gracilibacillus alcaliphilus]MBM7679827.1 sugar phosphate isomerase/epimerase [Gracilibacillus alcaliphilus]
MIRGVTGAGLGNIDDNQRFIELAAAYGFGAVDLEAKSLIDEYGVEGARELLDKHSMILGSVGLPVEWRQSEEIFQRDLVKLPEAAKAAADLGCTRCCTYILPSTDQKSAHFMALTIKRLRTCAEILDAYGVRLGLEYVGPHHLRTAWQNPFIWTQQETLDLMDAIGLSNVGLLLDAFHWYTNGLTNEDILALSKEQITHVHINDAPNVAVEDVLDNDRLYPGEGVIDLNGFLTSLKAIGYDGPISQEVLTKEPPTASAEELFSRSKQGFDKVFK